MNAPRQSSLVAAKLVETASRGLYVLIGTYALPLDQAGRFGLFVTLVGLLAFAAGFERQVELQRRLVGEPSSQVHARVTDALRFFLFNHALLLPLLLAASLWWMDLPWPLAVLCPVIVLAEQIANQTYQVSLINAHYRSLIFLAAGKNLLLIGGLIGLRLWAGRLEIEWVVALWLLVSLLFLAVTVVAWQAVRPAAGSADGVSLAISDHFRASLHHFLIGLVALLALQADRLIVASLLPADEVGRFFRNVVLTSLGYQVFNVVFFNRLAPRIFLRARSEPVAGLRAPLYREWRILVGLVIAGFVALWIASQSAAGDWLVARGIDVVLLGVLLAAFVVRAAADFEGLLLNARHLEGRLLGNQVTALLAGLAATVALTATLGKLGAAAGGLVLAVVYWTANRRSVMALGN